MRISDWSSDVCSSDLDRAEIVLGLDSGFTQADEGNEVARRGVRITEGHGLALQVLERLVGVHRPDEKHRIVAEIAIGPFGGDKRLDAAVAVDVGGRSEEHTSELQSLMRNSYAVF